MRWLSDYGYSLLGKVGRMSPAEIGEDIVRLLGEIHSYGRVQITDPSAIELLRGIHAALRRVDLDVAERTLRAWLEGRASEHVHLRLWLMASVLYAENGRSLPEPLVERVADVTAGPEDEGWRFARWFPEQRANGEDMAVVVARVERACAEIFECEDLDRRAEGAIRLIERITNAFSGVTTVPPRGWLERQLGPAIEPSMERVFEAMVEAPDPARTIRLASIVGSTWGFGGGSAGLGPVEGVFTKDPEKRGSVFRSIGPRFGELVRSREEAATVLAQCPSTNAAAPIRLLLAEKADEPELMAACVEPNAPPEVHVRVAETFARIGQLSRAIAHLEALPASPTRDATLRRLLVEVGRPHDALALYVLRPEDVPHVADALGLDRAVVIAHGTAHATDPAAWKRLAAERGVLADPDELLRGHFEPRDFHATLHANASASPRWIGKLCARALDLVFDSRSTWGPDDDPRVVLTAIFEAAAAAEPKKAAATRTRLAAKLRKHTERTPSYLLREAAFDVLEALETSEIET